jgi:acyl-CoA thioester hydrolase
VSFVHREVARFADCDPMGHLNNAVYSTFLEQARLAYFGSAEALGQADIILARTEIDFRSPVSVGETVEIAVDPGHLGTKSFELTYELRADGRLVAKARTVLVGYDYEHARSTIVPERWKRRLAE